MCISIPHLHVHLNTTPTCASQYYTYMCISIPLPPVHLNTTPTCAYQYHTCMRISIPHLHVHLNTTPTCASQYHTYMCISILHLYAHCYQLHSNNQHPFLGHMLLITGYSTLNFRFCLLVQNKVCI